MTAPRYEVIPHKVWLHTSGRKASIYGAHPSTNSADEPNWEIVEAGFTVRDNHRNTVGMCRPPFATEQAAQDFVCELMAL